MMRQMSRFLCFWRMTSIPLYLTCNVLFSSLVDWILGWFLILDFVNNVFFRHVASDASSRNTSWLIPETPWLIPETPWFYHIWIVRVSSFKKFYAVFHNDFIVCFSTNKDRRSCFRYTLWTALIFGLLVIPRCVKAISLLCLLAILWWLMILGKF